MLLTIAQAAVSEKYRQYEELASRDGSRFHPDVRPRAREQVTPAPPVLGHGGPRREDKILVPGD
jgi:hypothetical protein